MHPFRGVILLNYQSKNADVDAQAYDGNNSRAPFEERPPGYARGGRPGVVKYGAAAAMG